MGPTSFFYMGISSFPSTICWKDCLFPTKWSWHPCQKSVEHIWEDLFPGSLFYPIGLHLSLCQCHTVLITVNSEIRKVESSNFVLLFQGCFGYLESLRFHMNFRMEFFTSAKNVGGLSMRISLYLQITLGSIVILKVLSLQPMNMGCLSMYLSSCLSFSNVL